MSDTTPSQASTPTERPRCQATKTDGTSCTAYPAKGGKLCAGHAGLGKLDARAAAAKSAQVRQAKAERRKMGLLDYLADELENEAHEIAQTFKTAGRDGDWRAYDAWITRVHGKPIERVETTEVGGDVRQFTAEQRAELRRRLVAENPGLLELKPAEEAA